MLKTSIQGASSTNCISWVVVSKPAYSGIESRKVATDTTRAMARAVAGFFSPPAIRIHKPPTIGVQITRLKRGSEYTKSPSSRARPG